MGKVRLVTCRNPGGNRTVRSSSNAMQGICNCVVVQHTWPSEACCPPHLESPKVSRVLPAGNMHSVSILGQDGRRPLPCFLHRTAFPIREYYWPICITRQYCWVHKDLRMKGPPKNGHPARAKNHRAKESSWNPCSSQPSPIADARLAAMSDPP